MASSPSPIVVHDMRAARRSLRIAVVTETYPPEVNGVAVTLQRVVEGLRARQHDIQLVRPCQSGENLSPRLDNRLDQDVLLRGFPIPRYPELKMGVPSKKALVSLWSRQRPDLVYVATEGPLGWSALQAAARLKLPVCSDFRTNFHSYSQHYGIGWLQKPIMAYLRKFHNRTAFTMVPSEQLRQELADAGFARVVLVARGVDTAIFDPVRRCEPLRAAWGAGHDTVVALFVGRLAREKNLGALAAAFLAMRQARPDSRLVVVGDGPARQALAALVPDAIFTGTRSGEDLAAHYASADAFLFPSMTETFGNVTIEAMASGLAVVAFDHAAAGQLIRSGGNGLLASFGDEADFVRQAVHVATDREHAARMARQARATACELGWDRIVSQVESVFAATLDAGMPVHAGVVPEPVVAGVP
ncbi:glycosyltransferase family 1 protein [Variovorax sp. J22R133]|uniref:glycosyltransferase family 4 protein n=1 Tax=Variovorax brevis TaxID=3053503 RepID=UPI002577A1AE|nr:glycosyltransferase family 1 protein [Variovorax sp. J22R133]MDM0112730.1 glycosyltransferase family 1 protein [Variovorax sp. J22R133]